MCVCVGLCVCVCVSLCVCVCVCVVCVSVCVCVFCGGFSLGGSSGHARVLFKCARCACKQLNNQRTSERGNEPIIMNYSERSYSIAHPTTLTQPHTHSTTPH